MKKLTTLLLLFSFATILYSQKVETAKELLKANKLVEAKSEIDAYLQTNQKSPDAFYTKAKIYNVISQDPQLSKQYPGARMDAFNALKKYVETDDKMLIALQIDGYKPINEIYTNWYQSAATAFNNKDYTAALRDFKNAIETSKFMNEKGWIKMSLDTNSVLYAGVSAEKLSRHDEAVYYYGLLVKARVKGEGFVEIYKWVANYYFENKNYSDAENFTTSGKEVYPDDPFWMSLELDNIRATGNRDQLFAKYEETIAKDPTHHLYMYNYAVELYQYAYNSDTLLRPANSAEVIKKAEANLRSAIRLKPDYIRAQLFMGQIAYNNGVDVINRKGTSAGDVALKQKYFDEAIPYFLAVEKSYATKTKLTTDEKADLKEAYDLLITIYEQKNITEKVAEYQNKFNKLGN